jgi:hypothetical protein
MPAGSFNISVISKIAPMSVLPIIMILKNAKYLANGKIMIL